LPGKQPGQSHGMISSPHPNSANVTLLDGSVRPISDEIDQEVLRAMLSGQ